MYQLRQWLICMQLVIEWSIWYICEFYKEWLDPFSKILNSLYTPCTVLSCKQISRIMKRLRCRVNFERVQWMFFASSVAHSSTRCLWPLDGWTLLSCLTPAVSAEYWCSYLSCVRVRKLDWRRWGRKTHTLSAVLLELIKCYRRWREICSMLQLVVTNYHVMVGERNF